MTPEAGDESLPAGERRSRSVARDYLEALLIAVIFATFARTYVVQAFKIPTGSMEENLLVGDHILVNKFIYAPAATRFERWVMPQRPVRRGDVVVFKYPLDATRDYIKRCVAVGGDEVEIRNKALFVNGQAVDDRTYTYRQDPRVYPNSVFLDDDYRFRDNFGPYRVPPGYLFFLGDNRDNSNDSRFWGPVPASYVRGRALMVYWSFGGTADHGGDEDRGGRLARFFERLRWQRSLTLVR